VLQKLIWLLHDRGQKIEKISLCEAAIFAEVQLKRHDLPQAAI